MSNSILGDFEHDEEEWLEKDEEDKGTEVEEAEFVEDIESTPAGINMAINAFEQKGKSLMASLIGFCNTEYFDKMNIKEEFPLCYRLFHEGYVPEVEKLQVIDLDNSFKKLSKLGIFGRLVKPLYDGHRIKRSTIKIKKRQTKFVSGMAKEAAKLEIQLCKIKIENRITACVKDNGPEIALLIDSMSSYDELLNDMFRIVYEDTLSKPRKDEQFFVKYQSSLKGINQAYWRIRNGWWVETLRDKRSYKGWQLDTYKIENKSDLWYNKELKSSQDAGKDPKNVLPYIIYWAPRTKFDLDFILQVDNDGQNYWADVENRFRGNLPTKQKIAYSPNKRSAIFQILEQLAPYIMGEAEIKNEEDLW